jgi:hypothetical protein
MIRSIAWCTRTPVNTQMISTDNIAPITSINRIGTVKIVVLKYTSFVVGYYWLVVNQLLTSCHKIKAKRRWLNIGSNALVQGHRGHFVREFKLRVMRQTANARQRKMLRYQAIKSKWTCCFKTEINNYSFDARKRIWNANVQQKFCQESSNLAFAVPGNVKLKLPIVTGDIWLPSDLLWCQALTCPCFSINELTSSMPAIRQFWCGWTCCKPNCQQWNEKTGEIRKKMCSICDDCQTVGQVTSYRMRKST